MKNSSDFCRAHRFFRSVLRIGKTQRSRSTLPDAVCYNACRRRPGIVLAKVDAVSSYRCGRFSRWRWLSILGESPSIAAGIGFFPMSF